MSDDYIVGYGKPPKATQFQKNKSGNQRGRPKKRPPSYEDLLNALSKDVTVLLGNKGKKMHPFEAAVRKIVARAVTDKSVPHALKFLALLEKYDVLLPLPAKRKTSGVLQVPRSWDKQEWLEMYSKYGPPPWPGKHSGLTLVEEKLLKGDDKWMTKQELEDHRKSISSGRASPETERDARKALREQKA